MGQKTHPTGFRVGVIRPWLSKWYSKKDYATWLHEDMAFRSLIKKRLQSMGVAKVEIERAASKTKVNIHTSRPGLVIGKKGSGIDALKAELQKKTANELFLNIHEVRKAETDAQLVAENIALPLMSIHTILNSFLCLYPAFL